ncbi:LEAF RUST 10 DISEASE-RESISTANCE LOCUS RECEPTOR-LIKE PROTEIN KINASE-like 1.2 [Thalictrum thalictroides]|uniref:non-specific serine/threonine protein kinase n=1 Tax=Thalictrum thalictroides TaxID=46969 RepID=A0A7J6VYK3_THATH|nr:LEAF RUST 10 DISEASE-RESISTANCE LOCUS RECEPTOR-LIKE PROTEIN KINASE-like 1.2 [Thalictrum thalictroides]
MFIVNEFFFPTMFIKVVGILLVLLVETTLSADQQYEACEPRQCGDNLKVRFPFWIQNQHQSYCGHPGFEITCKDEEMAMIRVSNNDYIVRNISYEAYSVLVVHSDAYLDESCPTPLHNISLNDAPFEFGPRYLNLYFFYNCTSSPREYFTYPVPCATNINTSRHSFAAFLHQMGLEYLNASSQNCQSMVNAPVEMEEGAYQNLERMTYADILREGFLLNWGVARNNCTICETSGGRCGFDRDEFICFCPDRPHSRSCSKGPNKRKKIAIGLGTGLSGIFVTCMVFIFIAYRRRKRNKLASSSGLISRSMSFDPSIKPDTEKGSTYFQTPIFTYKELHEATDHFDTNKELGDGGFGTVYHGKLRDGRVVAVKRLFEHNYKRVEQFMNEIAILSRLRHRNLVTLYGCTNRHSRELLLVYEYVPNGTVADHLHGNRADAGLLTWPIRLTIAIESADALAYLHASDIIHRDVKTNNILLDNGFHVKVADFGLSRLFPTDVTHVSTAPQGTPGYVDPEYYQCYQLNDRSDVYSFGVVLIELISSKPAVDIGRHRHEINLANMAINRIHNQALHELVDPCLGFESDSTVRDTITLVAELAFRCLQQEKEMRPCMVEVLETLKGIESEDYKKNKADEIDISAAARLLKNSQPLSPDSVTDKWVSKSTTPNTSN